MLIRLGWSRQEKEAPALAVTDQPEAPLSRRAARIKRTRHRRRVAGAVLLSLLLVAGIGVVAGYAKLNANIHRLDVSNIFGTRPSTTTPTAGQGRPLNILVMGSDTRTGIGTTEYGSDTVEGGAHSDTNLVVHLSADRSWALVASIPRDSMTMAPRVCADPSSTVADGEIRQWNYNFNLGGPGCVIKTVEGLTNIYIDHYVVIDFRGFQDMVDALGGVNVCTTEAIDDRDSQFTLAPGRHLLNGRDALGYVRVRKSLGDGSDLNRIKRQQAFLSSVIQEATSTGLLLRPDRLFGFLNAATKSITSDPDLGLGAMTDIARSVKSLGAKNIQFVTVPNEVYPADPNRVQWKASAELIWSAMRSDIALTKAAPTSSTSRSTSTATSTTPATPLTVTPDQIQVSIVNDSGVDGLGTQAGAALAVQGFAVGGLLNGSTDTTVGTVVHHSSAQSEAARTVAAAFPGASLMLDETAGDAVVVHLGAGAANPVAVPNRLGSDPLPSMTVSASSSTSAESIETRNAAEDICG